MAGGRHYNASKRARGRPRKVLGYRRKARRLSRLRVKQPRMTTINIGRSLPQCMRIKLNYADNAKQVETVAGVGYSSYRLALSNLVDPDITGTGSQAPLFDNMKALYNNWRVVSATVQVTYESYVAFPTHVALVAMYDSTTNSPTAISNPSTYNIRALPSALRSKVYRLSQGNLGSNKNMVTFTKKFNLNEIIPDDYMTSVNFRGAGDSAPSQYAVCDLIMQTGGVTGSPNIGGWMSFNITYDVIFTDPVDAELAAYD